MSDAVGTRRSRLRWWLGALALSLALNLFFLGMVAGHFRHRHRLAALSQRERFERIAADLNMNDTQTAAFQQFQTILRVDGAQMRSANASSWARMADPATTPDQITALLTGTVKKRTEFQQHAADAMAKFLATLTPAQRATFIDEGRNAGRSRRK